MVLQATRQLVQFLTEKEGADVRVPAGSLFQPGMLVPRSGPKNIRTRLRSTPAKLAAVTTARSDSRVAERIKLSTIAVMAKFPMRK
jgi:hypothetical protein